MLNSKILQCNYQLKIPMKIMLYAYHEGKEISSRVIDGTKIEASANRYNFVWKKSTTKHQARFLQKKLMAMAGSENLEFVSGRGHRKDQLQKDIEDIGTSL